MSYILEALKKAQAERQLGSAPTIHAMPIQASLDGAAGTKRMPLIAGAVLGVLAIGAGGAIYWKSTTRPVTVAAAPVVVVPAATQPAVVQPVPAPVVAAPVPVQVPVPVAVPAPAPAPVPAPVAPPLVQAPPPVVKPKPPVVAEVSRVAAAPVMAPPPPVEAPEEHYPLLRELPEALQQGIPRVAIGGYIYSKNPADRLLLVDKVLRREGEDVGSGQVLEKLQSKAAVMNFRGTRYRIPY